MSLGSNYDFANLSDFTLNQILGYQDVNDIKSKADRLRDAFQRQHAWDDNTVGDAAWTISYPNWNLGDHVGNIGVAGQTTFYGDGTNLSGVGSSVSGMKGATVVASSSFAIGGTTGTSFINLTSALAYRYHWASVITVPTALTASAPCDADYKMSFYGQNDPFGVQTVFWHRLRIDWNGYIAGGTVFYKVYRIDET